MNEYVFFRINDRFKDLFSRDNLSAFLELYYRREESVFYKEQFREFLEKNRQREMMAYLKQRLFGREEVEFQIDRILLSNEFNESNEVLIISDNYLTLKGDFKKSVFSKYLCEYDTNFLMIDINKKKIHRLALVN